MKLTLSHCWSPFEFLASTATPPAPSQLSAEIPSLPGLQPAGSADVSQEVVHVESNLHSDAVTRHADI